MLEVEFKSIPEMFEKESNGLKCNTIRKFDLDDRFMKLIDMVVKEEYGKIKIVNTETGDCFYRTITDITHWKGWVIISWQHCK